MHSGLELAKKLQEAVLKCACWKPNASRLHLLLLACMSCSCWCCRMSAAHADDSVGSIGQQHLRMHVT